MVYTDANDSSLPDYIQTKPSAIRARWVVIFNNVAEREGEQLAFIVANKYLKKMASEGFIEAKSLKIRKLSFKLDTKDGFIKKSLNGEEYVSFVLTDTLPDGHGETYTPELLQEWADEINKGNMILGDIDHTEYDKILATEQNADAITMKLKEKSGIAKAVEAVFEKGKLWIKALIDKRYKKVLSKVKGLSLEAFIEDAKDNVATAGKLLGFSFMVNGEQANPRAVLS